MCFFTNLHLGFIYLFELVNLFKISAASMSMKFINILLYFCFKFGSHVSKMRTFGGCINIPRLIPKYPSRTPLKLRG